MYVIYHIASTMQVGPTKTGFAHSAFAKMYKSASAAARTCDKFNQHERNIMRDPVNAGFYGWCDYDHYCSNVVRTVTRVNIMSGREYQEASNTPGYCSPSSEAYWSA